ncbi:MAG: LamG-like jellyroll fold domain-containing protein, partial [Nanoarchaeota archaeon]
IDKQAIKLDLEDSLKILNKNLKIDSSKMTLSFWAKFESIEESNFIDKSETIKENFKGFSLKGKQSSGMLFLTSGDIKNNFLDCDISNFVGKLVYIVLTSEKNKERKIYINGKLCNKNKASSVDIKTSSDLKLNNVDGIIDELKIYSKILSDKNILDLYEKALTFCRDSDVDAKHKNGKNYDVKGTVISSMVSKGVVESSTSIDKCIDTKKVEEYFCNKDKQSSTKYSCPFRCFDGKCVTQICEDSDGNNKTVFGVVTITNAKSKKEYKDYCDLKNPNVLIEFTCNENNDKLENSINCGDKYVCLDGACVKEINLEVSISTLKDIYKIDEQIKITDPPDELQTEEGLIEDFDGINNFDLEENRKRTREERINERSLREINNEIIG